MGPFATLVCEPRQVRKEATVANDAGAEVWLVLAAMSYQVLARKWRPRNFQDMVGQEATLRILANALQQQRLHHAYLFTGTRGVGKTTLARILAKCLNCEKGITAQACDQCATCQAIDAGRFLDLFEIDAASRTKVEDTREILDNVPYPPSQGRYKVYLIDEVHMLSNHSFNALLKTLEEPPEHVKFLLATTDPKRLPATVLSRCLQFHLQRITPIQIAKHLQHICSAEAIASEEMALTKLAKAADGSLRDALSLLDQAIAFGKGNVTTTEVIAMLGSVAQDSLIPLLHALAEKDGKKVLATARQLAKESPDFNRVMEELISLLHHIAIAQTIPEATSEEDHEDISALAKCFSPEEIQLYYQIALIGRRDFALSPSPYEGFEMALLRMLAFAPKATETLSSRAQKTLDPAVKPRDDNISATRDDNVSAVRDDNVSATRDDNVSATRDNSGSKRDDSFSADALSWSALLPRLELSGMAHALASNCNMVALTDTKAEFTLSANHAPMLNPKLTERIQEALSRYLQKTLQVTINLTSEAISTPLKQHQEEQAQRLTEAKQTTLQNEHVKKIIEHFDAEVDVSLV